MVHLSGSARTFLVAALASTTVVTVGVLVASPVSPAEPALPSTLASLDTTRMPVPRAPFCDRIRAVDVEAALGSAPTQTTEWSNGDSLTVDGLTDIAHEYGCRWEGPTGSLSAWVFAPPVTTDRAAVLVRSAADGDGCRATSAAPAFGAPTLSQECPSATAGRSLASYRGLFGDAWVVCQRDTVADPDLTDRWCAAVATALSTVA